MSAALRAGADGDQAAELRAKLVQLANKVTMSPGRVSGDPRTATYIVKKGDNLRKIAKEFKITDDLIAKMNNLRSKSMIRQGARLKVARGPFQAIVHKRQHALDVFLDDVLVRSYKVGLGEHNSTPTGTWRVKNKLENPTYYPPRGGKIVHAEDPNNPLGEHWIGLEGIAGEAKGQERYGIHGTNEPDSIGKDASLGCVRMHNEDVAELYTLLVIGHSQVTIKDERSAMRDWVDHACARRAGLPPARHPPEDPASLRLRRGCQVGSSRHARIRQLTCRGDRVTHPLCGPGRVRAKQGVGDLHRQCRPATALIAPASPANRRILSSVGA
jgi:lipoprotein-anchoring transpeptidase ErfK/SrfK